ncbi:MAG: S8 family serine peptidase, partial [candidate division Zixibacteria bacterium]|nr:S8 family serine peptidase [candidate division Zixibacteria bacterium]NIR66754.1 S8 family serine peptidase [candidate division Zixibacteria bacterium]NIS15103.1 S8 family serine peptidase [candidate division Zixibacteria bacterium]NIS48301.1 S8 family serine peptidase [candidate division Zixibacteria bacterium]NIU16417.1 S8 family serine peptidase [candidate division Zixibacteria bacterium]
MNKRHHYQIFVCLLLMLLLPSGGYAFLHDKDMDERDIQIPTRLIVKVKTLEDSTPGNRMIDLNKIAGKIRIDDKYGITDTKPLFARISVGSGDESLSGIYVLEFRKGTDLEAAAREYEALEGIEYAHPDYLLELYVPPDDPHYGVQWPLNNIGQGYPHVLRRDGNYNDTLITMYGTPGADINALEVFENPPDNTSLVIIAVIDTGVDMDHPDLAGKIWQNPGEVADNGIDDDHNGYVDDIRGWDYTSGSGAPPVPDNDPSDSYGHGTHCSGIIASLTDNLVGMAGVVPDCKIMPLKFYPVMLSSYASAAIVYAADNGADVISMSFGYPWQIEILEDALEYARSKGVVLCAATGNDGIAKFNFPGAYPSVISVGASTSDDEVAFFSTYGEQMDVVAPGYSVLSLRAAGTDMYAPGEPNVHIIDENYYVASGTSMACPHAAAVAAYMMSTSPGLKPDAVQQIMQNTADDIVDPYGDGLNLPGWDQYSGHGRINLENALAAVPAIAARITSPLPNQILAGEISIMGSADGIDFTEYTLEYGSGSNPASWTTITTSTAPVSNSVLGTFNTAGLNGSFTIKVRVGDDNSDQVTINVANDNLVYLSAPLDDDTVVSQANVYGSAICPDFLHYTLEYKTISGSIWNEFELSTIPVMDDLLGDWQAGALPGGSYYLRVNLYSNSGLEARDTVEVYLEHIITQEGNWKIDVGSKIATVLNYGDFDSDGVNEIVAGTASGIKFYTTEGTEKTDGMPQPPAYNFRVPPAVGDLNGDGLDDLVAVARAGSDGKLFGYISDGQSFETTLPVEPNVSA